MKHQTKQTKIATFVALCCAYPMAFAQAQSTETLDEIVVMDTEISDALVNTQVDRNQIFLKQALRW